MKISLIKLKKRRVVFALLISFLLHILLHIPRKRLIINVNCCLGSAIPIVCSGSFQFNTLLYYKGIALWLSSLVLRSCFHALFPLHILLHIFSSTHRSNIVIRRSICAWYCSRILVSNSTSQLVIVLPCPDTLMLREPRCLCRILICCIVGLVDEQNV